VSEPWLQSVEQRLAVLETRKAVDEVHFANLTARLISIEDTLKWLVRLILGGLLLAGLPFLIQGGMAA
jgi:hypothetical protein